MTRTSLNQGILRTTGFINEENLNPAGTWSLGLLQMDFFYRKRPWYAGQFVRKIVPKVTIPPNSILFFQTILNAQKPLLKQVLVRNVDKTFSNSMVYLPQTAKDKIDFPFMEEFIQRIEESRVSELENIKQQKIDAYLTALNITDYILTPKEENTIQHLTKLHWQEFNLKKLFGNSTRGKRLKGSDRLQGNLPFVTAGEVDTGISAFIGNKVTIFKPNTTTIDMFGSAKYRNYEYGADDHVAVVHTENLPRHAAIFVTAACHKAAHTGKFNYGHNFYASDADELNIMLPTQNGVLDIETMETLISAAQKLVIKDVVDDAERRITATKQVIDK